MGDWIKENKFEAGLLLVVLLIAGGAYFLAGKKGDAYELSVAQYDDELRKSADYAKREPFPTRQNAAKYEEAVTAYRGTVESLQKALVAYRPAEFAQIEPSEFTNRLNAAVASLSEGFTAAGVEFPSDKFEAGFEAYTETPPRKEATAYLDYQLKAMTWLFGALTNVKPSMLLNVVREELPIEKGEAMDPKPTGRPRPGQAKAVDKAFYTLPIELCFRAPEAGVRQFLSTVAGAKDHYFVIRSLRIQNDKPDKGPRKDDVEFEDAPAADNPFGTTFDLIIPGEEALPPEGDAPAPPAEAPAPEGDPADPLVDPAPAPAPEVEEGERVLGQVLGSEELYVLVRLELLLFKDDVKLP